MGRRYKKVKIPKNRDIEEVVEHDVRKAKTENSEILSTQRSDEQKFNEQSANEQRTNEQRDNAQKVNTQTIRKEQEFRNRIKQNIPLLNKKMQNTFERRNAEIAEQKRKEEYLRAIGKLEEQQEEK